MMNRSLFMIWLTELKKKIEYHLPALYQQYLLLRPIPGVLSIVGWQQQNHTWLFYALSLSLISLTLFCLWTGSFILYMLWTINLASICYFFRRYELLISPAGLRYRLFLFGICYFQRHYDLMVEVTHWHHYTEASKQRIESPWVVIYNQSEESAFFQHFFHQYKDRLFFHIDTPLFLYAGHQGKQLCRVIQDQIYLSIQERMKNPIPAMDKSIATHHYWVFAWISLFQNYIGLKMKKSLGQVKLSWWEFHISRDIPLVISAYLLFLLYVATFPIFSFSLLLIGIFAFFSHRSHIEIYTQCVYVSKSILGISYFHKKYPKSIKQALCFDEFQSPLPNALILSEPRGLIKQNSVENVDFNDLLKIAQPWNCGEIYRLLLEGRAALGHFDR